MVLIRVDFPSPVWPSTLREPQIFVSSSNPRVMRTDADHVELEATFEKLAFNLFRDTVKTDMALWDYGTLLW